MIGKSYAKIAIVGSALCLAMVLCASFARYRSEQSFIDGAENGFGIDGMYVNDGGPGRLWRFLQAKTWNGKSVMTMALV